MREKRFLRFRSK